LIIPKGIVGVYPVISEPVALANAAKQPTLLIAADPASSI
jgi:hypothetical protein